VQGQILVQQDAGAWAYILPDHLGSVRQLVDSDSQVDLAQSFDPFGVPFETSGSGESDFGYTGEWWGSYNDLLFLRARYYDPDVGRFLTPDPRPGKPLEPHSLFPSYQYANNNPINFIDPVGEGSIHFQVILYYAYRYRMIPEYRIPDTEPPWKPEWVTRLGWWWGSRADLVDLNYFEVYEVEDVEQFQYPPHGRWQVERYVRELNAAHGGIGTAFVNDWKPGTHVKNESFIASGGLVAVDVGLEEPGVIVYTVRPTKELVEICISVLTFLVLKNAAQGKPTIQQVPAPIH
jgi:RHS repeat-associated protein